VLGCAERVRSVLGAPSRAHAPVQDTPGRWGAAAASATVQSGADQPSAVEMFTCHSMPKRSVKAP
jgi:hypothetical protein